MSQHLALTVTRLTIRPTNFEALSPVASQESNSLTPEQISQHVLEELAKQTTPIDTSLIDSITRRNSIRITELPLSKSSESIASDCGAGSSNDENLTTPEKSPLPERLRSYRDFAAVFSHSSPDLHAGSSSSEIVPPPSINTAPAIPSDSSAIFFLSQTAPTSLRTLSMESAEEAISRPRSLSRSISNNSLEDLAEGLDPVILDEIKNRKSSRPSSNISKGGRYSHSTSELGLTINPDELPILSTKTPVRRTGSLMTDYSSSASTSKSESSSPPNNLGFLKNAALKFKVLRKGEEKNAAPKRESLNRSASARKMSFGKEQTGSSSPGMAQQKRMIEGQLDYFISMRLHKLFYRAEIAEKELSKCLESNPEPIQRSIILQIILDLHRDPKNCKRLYEVLGLTMLKNENMPFVLSFLKKNEGWMTPFAQVAVHELMARKMNLLPVIEHATKLDLEKDAVTTDTLLRGTCLSNALCKAYGLRLWEKEIKQLDQIVHDEFKKCKKANLLIPDKVTVTQLLEKKDPNFQTLSAEEKDKAIAREVEEPAKNFRNFAFPVLKAIYLMQPPPLFSKLLQVRRKCIIDCLKEHPKANEDSNEFSRSVVSGDLFLRILNPHFSQDFEDYKELRFIIRQLAKVLQNIANEVRFGKERSDPIYEWLNPLYETFIYSHRAFVDWYSKTE